MRLHNKTSVVDDSDWMLRLKEDCLTYGGGACLQNRTACVGSACDFFVEFACSSNPTISLRRFVRQLICKRGEWVAYRNDSRFYTILDFSETSPFRVALTETCATVDMTATICS